MRISQGFKEERKKTTKVTCGRFSIKNSSSFQFGLWLLPACNLAWVASKSR